VGGRPLGLAGEHAPALDPGDDPRCLDRGGDEDHADAREQDGQARGGERAHGLASQDEAGRGETTPALDVSAAV